MHRFSALVVRFGGVYARVVPLRCLVFSRPARYGASGADARFSQPGCVRRNPDLAISPNRGVFGEIPIWPFLPTGVCSEKSRSGHFSQPGCVRRNRREGCFPPLAVAQAQPESARKRNCVGGGAKRRRRHYIAPSRSGLETPDQSTADPRQDQQVPAVAADRPNGGFWSGDDRKTTTYN